ncbi:hypothetical protein COT48_05245 [Candidatus Woesearchaeota archaeon CG08_land_8_20_14_0_20_47_9]|nr:MAG: hypothetical protein COT48_05245 [Candidatus Woesearchaeota archaeon CG08_land_8_20_14_0_20_47_9]
MLNFIKNEIDRAIKSIMLEPTRIFEKVDADNLRRSNIKQNKKLYKARVLTDNIAYLKTVHIFFYVAVYKFSVFSLMSARYQEERP